VTNGDEIVDGPAAGTEVLLHAVQVTLSSCHSAVVKTAGIFYLRCTEWAKKMHIFLLQ